MAAPDVEVHADAGAVAAAVAARLVALLGAATHAPFTIALAGGATPRTLYELLASDAFARRVPWDRVELFFGDERAVPPDHPDSNFGMVSRALLSRVDVRAHRMIAERGEAAAYETLLRERVPARAGTMPVLDVVLLGIGEDGHTASLFPGTAALTEQQHAVVMNDVPQLDTTRMTLTYPAINAARQVWLLVTGARKRPIVAGCLGGAEAGSWPVRGVQPVNGTLVWWLDQAAGGGVPHHRSTG
jgi:6-phosphogluconolactonase